MVSLSKDARAVPFIWAFSLVFVFFTTVTPVFATDSGFAAEALTLTPGKNTREINLTWYGNTDAGSVSHIKIASASVMSGDTCLSANVISGTHTPASAGKISHKVIVTGLNANTEYGYCVSNDGVKYSKMYTYKTPMADSFKFAVTGDPQMTVGKQDKSSKRKNETTLKGWHDTVASLAARGVNFIAGVGDQVDKTKEGDEAEYANFFAPDALRSIPFSPAIGNHDRHYLFNFHYNIPNELSFTPIDNAGNKDDQQYKDMEVRANYYYLYNNSLFVVLNDSGYPESKAVAAQYVKNFDAVLKVATQAHAGQYTWLFVQHHKSTASVADHVADRDIQYYVEAGFDALMDKYNVDFVLAGHDHVYARSYPMKGGKPDKTNLKSGVGNTAIKGGDGADSSNKPNGTVYFTATAASGLKYYELFNNGDHLYIKDNQSYPYLVNGLGGSVEYVKGNLPLSTAKYLQNKTPGYLYIEVSVSTASFKWYDLDDYANTPYDTYTVTK